LQTTAGASCRSKSDVPSIQCIVTASADARATCRVPSRRSIYDAFNIGQPSIRVLPSMQALCIACTGVVFLCASYQLMSGRALHIFSMLSAAGPDGKPSSVQSTRAEQSSAMPTPHPLVVHTPPPTTASNNAPVLKPPNLRGQSRPIISPQEAAPTAVVDANGKMVILRTFCPFDIDELVLGFEDWSTFFPCSGAAENLLNVDIMLYFSQSWELWPKAKEAADAIVTKFDNGEYPWSTCFGAVHIGTAAMEPSQDFYAPPQQQINRLWVNGPNRQFEKGLRKSQELGYELAYLMEPDSVPLKTHWMDIIRTEIEERRSFAVLGSRYRGDKWYDFMKQLEVPLLSHINGNAVYNVSHPLMNLMVGQLESEADQLYNIIPFDLRMGQMWAEGTLSTVQNMFPEDRENVALMIKNVSTPKNNTAQFIAWWQEHGFSGGPNGTAPAFQESSAIKNYAATNMLKKFLWPETVIHGAAMFQRWESNRPIALVVSDWNEGFLDEFLTSLEHDDHPFSEVVIMQPPGGHRRVPHRMLARKTSANIVTRAVERTGPDYMDICNAPVESEWFMTTNTYHNVKRTVDLLMTDTGTPLVPFIYSELPYCQDYPACAASVRKTRHIFNPDFDKYVADHDVPFRTDLVADFCADWEAAEAAAQNQRRLQYAREAVAVGGDAPTPMENEEEKCVPVGPTATGFIAYLSQLGVVKDVYKLKDKAQYGHRPAFRHTHESLTPNECLAEGIAINGTLLEKSCRDYEDADLCEATPGCSYDSQFMTCFEPGTLLAKIQAPPTMPPTGPSLTLFGANHGNKHELPLDTNALAVPDAESNGSQIGEKGKRKGMAYGSASIKGYLAGAR